MSGQVCRGGSSIRLLAPLPSPRWHGRKPWASWNPWAGRDTNPRGDAFYGDGRLVEACRRVRRSRPRVGSRDRSPRRTPTKEITGSRNRRGTPLIMDISAMETRMGGLVSDVSTTSLPSKSHHFVLANPRSIRILLLRSTIFLVRFLSRF